MTRVLVVGGGIAGLWTAVKAADAGFEVELVTKTELAETNTRYAQGGIAAALFPDDSADRHFADTLEAGAGLADPAAVRVLCDEGPSRVRDLIRFGVEFDRGESGLERGLEAAHSRPRILHAGGDATGAAIESALVATVRRRAVHIAERTMLVDLVVEAGTRRRRQAARRARRDHRASCRRGRARHRRQRMPLPAYDESRGRDGRRRGRRAGAPGRVWPTSSSPSSTRPRWLRRAPRSSPKRCAARVRCCATSTGGGSCSTCTPTPSSRRATSWLAPSGGR